jgi:hypothetical protein
MISDRKAGFSDIANLEGLLMFLHKKLLEALSEKDQQLLSMMEASIERLKKTILDLSDVKRAQKELDEEVRENIPAGNNRRCTAGYCRCYSRA